MPRADRHKSAQADFFIDPVDLKERIWRLIRSHADITYYAGLTVREIGSLCMGADSDKLRSAVATLVADKRVGVINKTRNGEAVYGVYQGK